MQRIRSKRHALFFVGLFAGLVNLPCRATAVVQEPTEIEFEKLNKQLDSNDESELIAAVCGLAHRVDRIDEFAKSLAGLTMSRNKLVRMAAERAFEYIGADAAVAIEPLLNSSERVEFAAGCNAVKAIGDGADRYRDVLIQQLANEDVNFRVAAMHAFSGFSNGAEGAVELVVRDLDINKNFNINLFACRALIKTGGKAKPAIPALVKLLENGNSSQRTYAAWTLGAIGANDEFETAEKLESMLGNSAFNDRERALFGLGLMGVDASVAEEKVRDMMNQSGNGLEPTAARVLWQITADAGPSVERLIDLSKKIDFEITALTRLSEMGSAAKSAADYLASRMASEDESVREAAIEALGNIGELTDQQEQALRKARASDSDPLVRLAAAIALNKTAEFSAAKK